MLVTGIIDTMKLKYFTYIFIIQIVNILKSNVNIIYVKKKLKIV